MYVAYVIHELLTDESIYKEGLNFLDYLFRHELIHEAGVHLLQQVLVDKRFIDEANLFGENLIAWVLVQPTIQDEFKNLIVKTLDDQGVK